MKPVLGKEPAAHSPLCSLLSRSPHRRWRDLNGYKYTAQTASPRPRRTLRLTCTTQTASPRARRRLRLHVHDADCVSCADPTTNGTRRQAPSANQHQAAMSSRPPTSSLSYPTCSRSRPQSADPSSSGWSSPLDLGVQGWLVLSLDFSVGSSIWRVYRIFLCKQCKSKLKIEEEFKRPPTYLFKLSLLFCLLQSLAVGLYFWGACFTSRGFPGTSKYGWGSGWWGISFSSQTEG